MAPSSTATRRVPSGAKQSTPRCVRPPARGSPKESVQELLDAPCTGNALSTGGDDGNPVRSSSNSRDVGCKVAAPSGETYSDGGAPSSSGSSSGGAASPVVWVTATSNMHEPKATRRRISE